MALDFSKLNFFTKLNARARILVLLGCIVGFIALIYFATQYFGGGDKSVGPSSVAAAPAGVAAVAGEKSLTAEYQRAVTQANLQAAEAAKMSGISAIPTQIYTGSDQGCVICSDKSANVKNLIDEWVRQGRISPDVAELLKKLANDNVSVDEYAVALQKLVKEGKITPERARALLEEYKKQHANANLVAAEQLMDELIKSGDLPLDAANELLEAQKKGMGVDEYAAVLQRMVREGKISPATAARLLEQYAQQQAKAAMDKHIALIDKMLNDGAITPDVAQSLKDLAAKNVSVGEYADALNKLVAQGKLTPEAAKALLESYQKAKAGGTVAAAAMEKHIALIDKMLSDGTITPDVAQALKDLARKNVSVGEYADALNKLVAQGKLTPEAAKALLESYQKAKAGGALADAAMDEHMALIDKMLNAGTITPDVARTLKDLANRNVSVGEYADALNQLVAQGKLTPEAAKALLESYQKAKLGGAAAEAAAAMDRHIALIDKMQSEGIITPDVARALKDLAKKNVSVGEYADALNQLVAQGKLTPEAARALLESYQRAKAAAIGGSTIDKLIEQAENEAYQEISDLLAAKKITAETAARLSSMVQSNVTLDTFKATINQMVQEKNLTPEIAQLKIGDYTKVKRLRDAKQVLLALQARKASPAEYAEMLKQLVKAGIISPQQAAQMLKEYALTNNLSNEQYAEGLARLVKAGMLKPEQAIQMLKEYAQANRSSPDEYAAGLKRLVEAGVITPEQATQLVNEYQAAIAQANKANAVPTATGELGELQQRLAQGGEGAVSAASTTSESDFAAALLQSAQETAQEKQARLDSLTAAMSGQAGQLVASWAPPTMQHKEGNYESSSTKAGVVGANGEKGAAGSAAAKDLEITPTLIKGGTILFAVLDTAINSDYPDSPIMATIVDGKYKGDKLLGKITTTKGVSGQMDRVSLTFTLMNDDAWPKSRGVTAYAIDPDTARTVLASSVDYHYLMRFGAMMGTAFLQGYANAVTTSGSSMSQSVNGTISSNPVLSSSSKIWVGLGQIGQTLGAATQNYINRPPTVRVDSGVSLGILFMSDVT